MKEIKLKKGKEESLGRFHPWVFSGAIATVPSEGIEEGEVVKHFLQGARYPFLTIYNAAGTTLKFGVPMNNENLKEWMGGEIVKGQWLAPRGNYQTLRSLELMTEFDVPIRIPAATCYGVRKFAAKTTDVSLVEITAVVELPEKANESPMIIGEEEGSGAEGGA